MICPYRRTLTLFGMLLSIMVVMVGVFVWKISQGPLYLPQLASYIETNANKNTSGLNFKVGQTLLSWQGWERYLDIRLIDIEISSPEGGRLALLPETAISLSPTALLDGIIAPRHIELFTPKINLVRHEDGALSFQMDQSETIQSQRKFNLSDLLGRAPDPQKPQSYLSKISVINADIKYQDLKENINLHAPMASFDLQRTGDHIELASKLDVFVEDVPVQIGLQVDHNLLLKSMALDLDFVDFPLKKWAHLHEQLTPFKETDFPVSAQIQMGLSDQFALNNFQAHVFTKQATFKAPEPLDQVIDVERAELRMSYDALDQIVSLEEFALTLPEKTFLELPAPFHHSMPVSSLRMNGQLDQKSDILSIRDFVLDLGEGPVATLSADISNALGGPTRAINLVGEVLNVETSNLHRYWPKSLNDNAREWVVTNLSDGIVPRAGVNLSLDLHEDGTTVLNHVYGDMEMEGLSVDYLKPLPKVRNAKGWARYDDKTFNITVTGGEIGNIKLTKGQLDITGFELYDQTMHVDLTIDGPLRDIMEFIDREPLGFASALDLDPQKTDGFASTDLKMSFLLIDDLKLDDVFVEAASTGKDVVIEDVFLAQNLSQGDIKLKVDKSGMDLSGNIVLGSIPAALTWRENFTKETLFQSRFVIAGTLNEDQRAQELNLNFAPFTPEYIAGDVGVNVTVTESWDDLGKLDAFIDLQGAEVNIPGVYWTKEKGRSGEAYVNLSFNSDQIIGVPYFSVLSNDLEASGSVKLSSDGTQLHTLALSRFKAGRTDITQATVLYSDQVGWQVDAYGPSLDIEAALNREENTDGSGNGDTDILGTLSARFDKIWIDQEHYINNVAGAITSDGRIWTEAHLTAQVGYDNQQFVMDISPNEDNRRLIVKTLDAGSLLKSVDLFDNMQGGELKITATLNDQEPNRPMIGKVRLDDFRILNVPLLARVLNLAGLTGILDSLSGEGIGFNSLDAPFRYEDGIVEFKDGRTNGVSLGLTWQGELDLDQENAAINGTVVPMYLLNSALGNVPLIGQLFSGGQKGGGLFAWNYNIQGPLDEADIKINPISGLAPGYLRRIFETQNTENAQAN